jgi:acyl-coenzyme A thioesterase PaaI-like protein
MGRKISNTYLLGRKLVTGVTDPSGLKLAFELDGNRVYCNVDANESISGRSRVVPASVIGGIVDDLAHATVAALKKRIGVTREARVRFLKPLYAGEVLRADGTLHKDGDELFTVQARLMNPREQLCVEAEIEIFGLSADQARRMTPDGMLPADLKRYLP